MVARLFRYLLTLFILTFNIAACSPSSKDCARTDVLCVGLVTGFGGVDDHGLNQSAWAGVQAAQAEGLVHHSAFIETVDARDHAKNIRTFAEAGYDIIVTVGFALGDETRLAAADEWPGLTFIGVDQAVEESRPNLAIVTFPEDQGGYLAGALAALTTRTGKIAALCETESLPEMWRTCEGFRAGARSVSATVNVRVIYHADGSPSELFNDRAWGEERIPSLKIGGVDIIFAAGGATADGVLESAAGRGMMVIGADVDQYYEIVANDFALNSAQKQAGLAVHELLAMIAQGKFSGGEFVGQYALGSYHALERLAPPTVRARLEGLASALAQGAVQTNVRPAP